MCVVWSHWHWDHVGDPSRFPPETKLIVGPGFKKEFVPDLAFPAAQNGLVLESDWEGRELVVCSLVVYFPFFLFPFQAV